MIHLTHTGFYAGVVFCGQPRNESDRYEHPAYSREGAERQRKDMCPACKRVDDGEDE